MPTLVRCCIRRRTAKLIRHRDRTRITHSKDRGLTMLDPSHDNVKREVAQRELMSPEIHQSTLPYRRSPFLRPWHDAHMDCQLLSSHSRSGRSRFEIM